MRRQNVHLRSVQNDAAMSDPVYVALASKQAHDESKRKSDAVKSGMRHRREAGKYLGAPPYGTEVRDGELAASEPEAAIVARIWSEYASGRGQRAITRGLRADDVPTQRGGEWH
jgi:site-specific DNA recombinase